MSFEPIKRATVAERIAETIREAIVGGHFEPGDSLPAERDLAGQFGVNRASIREALGRLEAIGLVEVRQGGATRVSDFLETAGLQILPYLLAPGGHLDPSLLKDLLELRVLLLGWTARQAAGRISEEAIERLVQITHALAVTREPKRLQELDYDFFEILVESTGNRVLNLIANAIRRVYLHHAEKFALMFDLNDFSTEFHQACIDALIAGDANKADEAMTGFGRTALEMIQ